MSEHCCEEMRVQVERTCEMHPDRYDCPDCLIAYAPHLHEYGLIIDDGGTSKSSIRFCPWCGAALPRSLRDRWFDELEAMGVDPWAGEVAEPYRSDAWYREDRASRPGA